MNWSAIDAVLLALAVGLGVFGAHGLRSRLTVDMLDIYKTAVLCHFLHARGAITPIGGAALIAAWAWLAWNFVRRQ